ALFADEGLVINEAATLPSVAEISDVKLRLAIVKIRLAQGRCATNEIKEFASEIVQQILAAPDDDGGLVPDRALERHGGLAWFFEFIMEVRRQLPASRSSSIGQCVGWLENYIGERRRPLHDHRC